MSETNVVPPPPAVEPAAPIGLQPPGPQLIAAISAVQGEIRSINKDREVTVKSEKGTYKFKYATLSEIWEAIRASCAKHGLAIAQPSTVDHARKVASVRTIIMHTSGQSIESLTELPIGDFRPQGIGSIISYARRYGLSSLLGVTSSEDDDDAAESQQQREAQPLPQQAQQTRAPAQRAAAAPKAAAPNAAPTGARFEELKQWFEQVKTKGELTKAAGATKRAADAGEISADEKSALTVIYKAKSAEVDAAKGDKPPPPVGDQNPPRREPDAVSQEGRVQPEAKAGAFNFPEPGSEG